MREGRHVMPDCVVAIYCGDLPFVCEACSASSFSLHDALESIL